MHRLAPPLALAAALCLPAVAPAVAPAAAQEAPADLVALDSPHDVSTTLDRLEAAVEGAGATVFARIDHGAGAAGIDMTIPANAVLIFGNPALGTPLIAEAPSIGLDLPIRVQAHAGEEGTVLLYRDPEALAAAHGIAASHPSIVKMTGALEALTAKAVAME